MANPEMNSCGMYNNITVSDSEDVALFCAAHTMSHANKIAWLDANTIITAGQDSNVKQFTVSD